MASHRPDPISEIRDRAPNRRPVQDQNDDHPGDDHDHDAPSLRVVVAPDSFKGSVAAADAATAIADGWNQVRRRDRVQTIPLADGGEGTVAAIAAARPDGVLHRVPGLTGPDGRPVTGSWLQLGEDTAVIEMADVSGLVLMAELDALGATTRGLGELIADALDAQMSTIVVGAGGSATTDGGAGALSALGLELLDADGEPIPDGGAGLTRLRTVRGVARRPEKLIMLSDVEAPLLGEDGAATVFAPQKGADRQQVALLDQALQQFAVALGGSHDLPGMGAAGGLGYGLVAGAGAEIVPGAPYLAELAELPQSVRSADVVITGEGRFDATSLGGKVVGYVLGLAAGTGSEPSGDPVTSDPDAAPDGDVRCLVIAGQVALTTAGVPTYALVDLAGSTEAAIADPIRWLTEAGARAAAAV